MKEIRLREFARPQRFTIRSANAVWVTYLLIELNLIIVTDKIFVGGNASPIFKLFLNICAVEVGRTPLDPRKQLNDAWMGGGRGEGQIHGLEVMNPTTLRGQSSARNVFEQIIALNCWISLLVQ